MSIYNVRYRIEYYRKSGGQTTIDILEKDYIDDSDFDASSEAGPKITSLTAYSDPLEITYDGDITNVYKPTVGSGATIKVVAEPLSLIHLFNVYPQQFIVEIYDGESGTNMFWQGFITAGMYTESYSTPLSLKHVITIYCNNGMTVLEDIPYTQTIGGSNYTGTVTIGEVLDNILSKLALSFTYIRSNHTWTHGIGAYAGTTNFFTALKVNNENYYDEEGVAMSCREVLEAIFGSLGLVISFRSSLIICCDPLDLMDLYHGQRYDASPAGANETSLVLGTHLDISAGDIGWGKTGSVMDITQQFNQVEINYDPYSFTDRGYDFNGEGNAGNLTSYGSYTDNGIDYNIYVGVTMLDWALIGTASFVGYEQTAPTANPTDYYIRMTTGASPSNFFVYDFPFSNIKQDNNLMIELSMSVYVNTKNSGNIWNPVEAATVIDEISLFGFQLKVGDKYFDKAYGEGDKWSTDTSKTFCVFVRELDAEIIPSYYVHGTWFRKRRYVPEYDTSEINDKKVTALVYIPLSEVYAGTVDLISGTITLRIPEQLTANSTTGIVNVLLSDINLAIVNTKKTPISNDGVLTKGEITGAESMKKSKLDVRLQHGIGPYGTSKGAFSSDLITTTPGINITGLVRDGLHTTNELLLQSLLSQYKSPRNILTGCLDIKDWVYEYGGLGIFSNLIYDSNHLINEDASVKKFYIGSGIYKDREETLDAEMIELANSREAIV